MALKTVLLVKNWIEKDRKKDYFIPEKIDYYHRIRDKLSSDFEIIDSDKHTCKTELLYILEHTDYCCRVLYYCSTCNKIVELID